MAVIKVLLDEETDKKIREKAKRYGFPSVQQFLLFMAQNGQATVK